MRVNSIYLFLSILLLMTNKEGISQKDEILILSNELNDKRKDEIKTSLLFKNGQIKPLLDIITTTKQGMLIMDRAFFRITNLKFEDCLLIKKYLNDSSKCIFIISKQEGFSYNPLASSTISEEILKLLNGYILKCYPCGKRWSKEEIFAWLEIEKIRTGL